jgi:DNA repair protein RecN (Recombination protein N)
LTQSDRIEEIARMLGGIDITDKAREHAAEMLKVGAGEEKKKAKKK